MISRRGLLALGVPMLGHLSPLEAAQRDDGGSAELPFRISLAQWSLHRALFAGRLDPLDFATLARTRFGIEAVEYVNQFFFDKAEDRGYLEKMKQRAEGEGVRSLLIMCDGEGRLGDPDAAARRRSVDRHRRWVDAARFLGCHAVRVNAHGEGSSDEQRRLVADGLRSLTEHAAGQGLDVLVENHGGLSADADWLAAVVRTVDHPRCGTLPDFGNFPPGTDRYRAVATLMPWARAVSAKSFAFDAEGRETTIDYRRMIGIVLDAGYRGWMGIEFEGDALSEPEGILATKRLLERTGRQWAGGR